MNIETSRNERSKEGPFKNRLYRTELGRTPAGDPFLKVIPTNPKGAYAGERQIAACIYEIAAELERQSDEFEAPWFISPDPSKSKITIELGPTSHALVAEKMIEKVLSQMQLR